MVTDESSSLICSAMCGDIEVQRSARGEEGDESEKTLPRVAVLLTMIGHTCCFTVTEHDEDIFAVG